MNALALLCAIAAAHVFSFDEVLHLAQQQHAAPQSAVAAANALDRDFRTGPTVRAETTITRGNSVDLFTTNIFHADALTTLVSLDYPLLDDGSRDEARYEAALFRERLRDTDEALYRETVDAVAQLYVAQERVKLMRDGLDRAIALRTRAQALLASHEISNTTAAQWEEEAIAAQAQQVDLELQRLDAETRVRTLTGVSEDVEVCLECGVAERQSGRETEASDSLSLRHSATQLRPQLLLSAFGGVASISDGPHYGLYGLRLSLALPYFDAAAKRRVAEARLNDEELAMDRKAKTDREKQEQRTLELNIDATQKRIALLQQAVDVAKEREGSVARLVTAGVRAENNVAEAAFERTRRESDLLAARVDLWKYQRLLEIRR